MLAAACLAAMLAADPAKLAREYASAVERANEEHARKPVVRREEDLAAKLPAPAERALKSLLAVERHDELAAALLEAGRAALDLDRTADFEAVRAKLAAVDPERAKELGIALSRPRFVAIGEKGVEPEGLEALADAFDLVLDAYGEVFGITTFSKVPGKKLRLRAHLEERIETPPHFAPQFPYHSEIDFPVVDATSFRSPTADGKFLFYGLCHELGHVVAMWGDRSREADHHAWAHYTGVAIVEHLAKSSGDAPALAGVEDVKWRSLELEREQVEKSKAKPSLESREAVLALLLALHDRLGPKAIGAAVEAMAAAGQGERIHRVRYYRFEDFEKALFATPEGKKLRPKLAPLFR